MDALKNTQIERIAETERDPIICAATLLASAVVQLCIIKQTERYEEEIPNLGHGLPDLDSLEVFALIKYIGQQEINSKHKTINSQIPFVLEMNDYSEKDIEVVLATTKYKNLLELSKCGKEMQKRFKRLVATAGSYVIDQEKQDEMIVTMVASLINMLSQERRQLLPPKLQELLVDVPSDRILEEDEAQLDNENYEIIRLYTKKIFERMLPKRTYQES